jgi:hypothetical protein
MKNRAFRDVLLIAGLAVVAFVAWGVVRAQDANDEGGEGRRTFPGRRSRRRMTPEERAKRMEEFRQRMQERLREDLGFSKEEWQAVAPRYQKVTGLQRQLARSRFGGMMGWRRRRPGGGEGRPGEGATRRPSPPTDQSALGKARQKLSDVLAKEGASTDEMQAALQGYREARQKVERQLKEARASLRELLNTRQEALLVLRGVLD